MEKKNQERGFFQENVLCNNCYEEQLFIFTIDSKLTLAVFTKNSIQSSFVFFSSCRLFHP
jgi:hypothetical protein